MPDHLHELAHPWASKKRFLLPLFALVLLSLTAWLGLKARNAFREYDFIGVPVERNTITVSGEGKVTAIPDIAAIDLGTVIEKPTVQAAQQENTRIMNALIAKLKDLGVDKKDIQTTGYSINPSYDWNNGKQTLRGYQVSQNVHVKVRNLDTVGDVIGAAGGLGANQVGGIDFTLDKPEAVKQQARIKALENAKMKADALAQVVGVKLRRVVSFSEQSSSPGPRPYYAEAKMMGIGGAAPAPTVEPGSTEITVNADVTYEIE